MQGIPAIQCQTDGIRQILGGNPCIGKDLPVEVTHGLTVFLCYKERQRTSSSPGLLRTQHNDCEEQVPASKVITLPPPLFHMESMEFTWIACGFRGIYKESWNHQIPLFLGHSLSFLFLVNSCWNPLPGGIYKDSEGIIHNESMEFTGTHTHGIYKEFAWNLQGILYIKTEGCCDPGFC